MTKFKCPICGKSDDMPVVLVGIAGTQEGHIMEAEQFHLACIDLTYYPGIGRPTIAMTWEEAV
jgi:hypothetical protein